MKQIPVAIRTILSASELAEHRSYDAANHLGSYWVRKHSPDLQSQIVKYFKSKRCDPKTPLGSAVIAAYADLLWPVIEKLRPNAILRVLSSSETRPDPTRPLAILSQIISSRLSIPDVTSMFFRIDSRKPMRMICRLEGADVLKQRINYVIQDLFILPQSLHGTVVLLDDIYNLGATAQVYSEAIKRTCGAEKVYSVNLAATRFLDGKDGWGRLTLDVDRFVELAKRQKSVHTNFDFVWIDPKQGTFHIREDCPCVRGQTYRTLMFLAEPDLLPCPECRIHSAKRLMDWFKRS